jgi:type II secretory pathway pseudopilin PulG
MNPCNKKTKSNGYSLFELLTVMVVLAITTVTVLPILTTSRSNSAAKATIKNIENGFMFLKQYALGYNETVDLCFYKSGGKYTSYQIGKNLSPTSTSTGTIYDEYEIPSGAFSRDLTVGTDPATKQLTRKIQYAPDGTITFFDSANDPIIIADNVTFETKLGSKTYEVILYFRSGETQTSGL